MKTTSYEISKKLWEINFNQFIGVKQWDMGRGELEENLREEEKTGEFMAAYDMYFKEILLSLIINLNTIINYP